MQQQTDYAPRQNCAPIKDLPQRINRLIVNLPDTVYRSAEGINQSGLAQILKSPAHYQHWLRSPEREPTPAMRLGTLTHLCVLEPEVYEARVVVAPGFEASKGTTLRAQKAEWHDSLKKGAVVASQADHDSARAMRDSVWKNKTAAALLAKGEREACLWWQDTAFDVLCKARIDFVSTVGDKGLVLDLKTTKDASRVSFSRSVIDRRYDLQAVHYLEGGRASGAFDDQNFLYIAVENTPPHACVVYTLSDAMRGIGTQWRDEAMSRYAEGLRTSVWPGLPEADEVGTPKWARVPGEEDESLI